MIELQNVSKVYKNKKYALNDISIKVDSGEFVYIVGHSGAGKSTFLRLLYRQEKASSGKVLIDGKDIAKIRYARIPKYRRKVGLVFQDYQLLSHKTAYENVAYALEVRGESKKNIRIKVRETLELVGLSNKEKSFPSQLSGGEQQRVAIARAIINRPDILIADEPTGNLDPVTSRTILNVLDAVNELGTTVVVATHDQYMVNNHPKRTITFKNGIVYNDAEGGGYIVGDDAFDTIENTEIHLEETGTITHQTQSVLEEVYEEMREIDQEDITLQTDDEKFVHAVFENASIWDSELDQTLFSTFSDASDTLEIDADETDNTSSLDRKEKE